MVPEVRMTVEDEVTLLENRPHMKAAPDPHGKCQIQADTRNNEALKNAEITGILKKTL